MVAPGEPPCHTKAEQQVRHQSKPGLPADIIYNEENHLFPSLLFRTEHRTLDYCTGYNLGEQDFLNKTQINSFQHPDNLQSNCHGKTRLLKSR